MIAKRQVRIGAVIALMLIGVLLFQFGAFDAGHDQNHARHCCAACHAGHITASAEISSITVAPPSVAHWHATVERAQLAAERLVNSGCSRAPPA